MDENTHKQMIREEKYNAYTSISLLCFLALTITVLSLPNILVSSNGWLLFLCLLAYYGLIIHHAKNERKSYLKLKKLLKVT